METRHERRQRERAEQVALQQERRESRTADLESMSKAELAEVAERQGVVVTREDGEGDPLKADYIRALS